MAEERIRSRTLAGKVMSADEAAALAPPGSNVGMSGFTGAGYPKAVPSALARRIREASARGQRFTVGVWTGASTAPELDGVLAAVEGIDLRMPTSPTR
jgi:succinyl-CoA:acetate CoA-transferase